MRTGPGPYRRVTDNELRDIFYLKSMVAKSPWFWPASWRTTTPPPEVDKPVVTQLLRGFLYIHAHPSQTSEMGRAIETQLHERNDIAIRAKLLSLVSQVHQKPWSFPVCVSTQLNRKFYVYLNDIAEKSDTAANTLGDPMSGAAIGGAGGWAQTKVSDKARKKLVPALSMGTFATQLVNYFGGVSNDYYEFYAKRISDELALRGIPPSSL